MSSNVPNWDATINKVVNTTEGELIGNVEATDESAVLVSSGAARTHYRFPKTVNPISHVQLNVLRNY